MLFKFLKKAVYYLFSAIWNKPRWQLHMGQLHDPQNNYVPGRGAKEK